MKQGFSLIELIIATLIATIIGGALWSAYYQTNRSVTAMGNIISLHEKAALVLTQFERDIAGAFIPWQPQEKEKKDVKQPEPTEQQNAEQQATALEQPKKTEKKITHIFYSTTKEKNLDTLTFITNNPMQAYWGSKTGSAKPRIARVVYKLVPQKQIARHANTPAYQLVRQESPDLDFNAYKPDVEKPIRGYEVIDGIKELTISYGAFIEKKSTEDTTKSSSDAALKPEYATFNDWNLEDKETGEQKQQRRALPHEVLISLSLWDTQRKRATTFETTILIVPDVEAAAQDPHVQEENNKQQQENAVPQKPVVAQRPSLGLLHNVFPMANQILQEITLYNNSTTSAS